MSTIPPYFDSPQEPQFQGEMPFPEPVGAGDVGVSILKANADHTHSLIIGATTNPWKALLLGPQIVAFGGSYRIPEYCLVGNLVFVRGVVNCAGYTGALGTLLGTLPVGFLPAAQEIGIGFGGNPQQAYRIDTFTNGNVVLMTGIPNPGFLSFGSPYMIFTADSIQNA